MAAGCNFLHQFSSVRSAIIDMQKGYSWFWWVEMEARVRRWGDRYLSVSIHRLSLLSELFLPCCLAREEEGTSVPSQDLVFLLP